MPVLILHQHVSSVNHRKCHGLEIITCRVEKRAPHCRVANLERLLGAASPGTVPGGEAGIIVKAVYETPYGREVSSAD